MSKTQQQQPPTNALSQYKSEKVQQGLTSINQLKKNAIGIGDALKKDSEVVFETGHNIEQNKENIESDLKGLAHTVKQIIGGNKRRRMMILYVIAAFFIVNIVTRITPGKSNVK